MSDSPKCLFCGSIGKLAEAHIIPRSFYQRNGKPLILVSKFEDKPKLNQTGIYDKEILCADCDNEFGEYDRVAAETLRTYPSRSDLSKDENGLILRGQDDKPSSYEIKNPEVSKLQRFFASLIWKCSVTTRTEMKMKKKPKFFDKAQKLLTDANSNDYFSVMGIKVFERQLNGAVSNPVFNDSEFGEYVQFHLAGFVASVFLEPLPNAPLECQLLSSDLWSVGLVSHFNMSLRDSMQEMAPKISVAAKLFGGR
jgi:hypothetical protein